MIFCISGFGLPAGKSQNISSKYSWCCGCCTQRHCGQKGADAAHCGTTRYVVTSHCRAYFNLCHTVHNHGGYYAVGHHCGNGIPVATQLIQSLDTGFGISQSRSLSSGVSSSIHNAALLYFLHKFQCIIPSVSRLSEPPQACSLILN